MVIAITRLPPGVCYGDSGDLQLSSVTLGIEHPPGYPILSTIGYILTRIPFVEPAYIITLACALSGAIAAYLCGLIQIRLGVRPMIAAAVTALFIVHPRFWTNVTGPEVYMPALAMLMGSVYNFMGFATGGSRRHFAAATLLFGATLFTRPPTLFALPFFLLATLMSDKRRKIGGMETAKRTLLGALLIALPGLYSFGFILARDRADVPYNYIHNYNAEHGSLPDTASGPAARVERAIWMMTGKQFADKMGTSWRRIRFKMRWIRDEALSVDLPMFISVLAIVGAGMVLSWYCERGVTVVLSGLAIQTMLFVCAYDVFGQAADLLPLLAATMIFVGVATSAAIGRLARHRQAVVAATIAILSVGITTGYLLDRPSSRGLFDATDAIAQTHLATLPVDSVIISAWGITTPLRYAHFYANRPDIHIATVTPSRWAEFVERFDGRPVFVPRISEHLSATFHVVRYRNLYRLEPRNPPGHD